MIGGFMGVGTPERVVDEIVRQRKRTGTAQYVSGTRLTLADTPRALDTCRFGSFTFFLGTLL
jgi:hypothetical protein